MLTKPSTYRLFILELLLSIILTILSAIPSTAQTLNPPNWANGYINVPGGATVNTIIINRQPLPNNLNILAQGAITTWNITLPNPAFDGQLIYIGCPGGNVATINISTSDGSTIAGANTTSCTVGLGVLTTYQYSSTLNYWYLLAIDSSNSVSVLRFPGAICNGVNADDSPGFTSAFATGENVFVPAGKSCKIKNLVMNAGNGQTFSAEGASLNVIAGANWGLQVQGFEPHVYGLYINDAGATVAQTTLTAGINTGVGAAYVVNGGSGGTAGTCTLTGTTGIGTNFAATIVETGAALTAGAALTITSAGSYSVNPTNYQNEPVTQSGCGSLTGVTVALNMNGGSSTLTIANAAANPGVTPAVQVGQHYQIQQEDGSYRTGFITSVSGNTIGIDTPPIVPVASGTPFWSTFGSIYVTGVSSPVIDDVRCNNSWGCLLTDDFTGNANAARTVYTQVGVESLTLTRLQTLSGQMFAYVKGRSTQTAKASNNNLIGGWNPVASWTATGGQTVFNLPYYLNLIREVNYVKVNGAAIAYGTGYTLGANGLTMTLTSAPGAGATVTMSYYSYGGIGYEDDCAETSTSCGGNLLADSFIEGWSTDIDLNQAAGPSLDNVSVDAAAVACLLADGTQSYAKITGLGLFWCKDEIRAIDNAAAFSITTANSNLQPSSYPVSGIGGVLSSIDVGSTIDWPGIIKNTTGPAYQNADGFQTLYTVSGSGNPLVCWGCPPATTPTYLYEWMGPGGGSIMGWNGSNTFTFTGAYTYISDATSASRLYLQYKSDIVLAVNGVNDWDCGTGSCAAAVPVALQSYIVSGLPSCFSGLAGAIAYVTDATSPTYNATLSGSGGVKTLAMCNGTNWTAH